MNINDRHGAGATRIDRIYCYGDMVLADADLVSVAFSDHLSYIVILNAPSHLQKLICPKCMPFFKTSPVIVNDKVFQARLCNYMHEWYEVKNF